MQKCRTEELSMNKLAMPTTRNHLRITEFASRQAVLQRYLGGHREWIEALWPK
jgi:hypothetical protein